MEPAIPKVYKAEVEVKVMDGRGNMRICLGLGERMKFEPGQYITIVAKINGVTVKRCYSIWYQCGHSIMIMLNYTGGPMTEYLFHEVDEGDYLKVIGPMGLMTIADKLPHKFFISTGTGIVPFACMIDKLLQDPNSYMTLVASFKHLADADFYDCPRIKLMADTYPKFQTYLSLTRDKHQSFYNSRVTKLMAIALDHPEPPYEDTEFYVCGINDMVVDVKKELLGRGVNEERIITEQYD